jgi:hypothetical protein
MTRTRRAAAALLTLAVSTAGLVVTATPAQAAAPVTVADTASAYAGNAVEVQPLANDSDADGDELAVCRVAKPSSKKVEIILLSEDGGSATTVLLVPKPSAKPGTYTFTYYACDFQTLVPGTITLTVEERPDIVAKALPGQPGKIKVKNPADFKIVFIYGSFEEESPDGQVRIAKGSSVVLKVRRTQIDWIAIKQRGKDFLDQGTITGIKLPPSTAPPAAGRMLLPRVAKLWASGS